ncbi:MAG TPA: diaminopimelate decarboxylase [Ktedonobacteraceae bacterium]|jgi:diaminopimelate decarboxylase
MDIRHLQPFLPDSATFSAEGVLHIARHSLPELAQAYGTPLYIFDRATIVRACQMYTRAFREIYHASESLILYASKAYLAPLVAHLVAEQGLGLDVVSGGELLLAQRARVPMERISFHGNNKSEEELRQALRVGVGRIVLDNWNELERLTRLARETGSRPGVLVRVAPEIKTITHRYLQTGHASSKFGFHLANGEAKAALLRIIQDDCLDLLGLHAHTGTMLREARPYAESLERLLVLAADVREETGWWPCEISPGGGWGIDTPEAEGTPDIAVLASALQESMLRGLAAVDADVAAPRLIVEPGRSIIARAGLAVYRIGARKPTPGGITYLFVDGGMADNIRPALYGAIYTAFPVERALDEAQETVCISGRYCESGDLLVEEVQLPLLGEGELLAMPTVGAYCLPMASNYNLVPRPIVLLIDEQSVQIMERRETHEDLFSRYPF